MSTKHIPAGFDHCFYGLLDSSGNLKGNSVAGASNGTIQGMLRLEGARTIPLGIPEDEVTSVTGDNRPLVSFSFPGADLPSGILEMATRNLDFEAIAQGTSTETIGGIVKGALAPSNPAKPDVVWMFQRRSKKWQDGARGVGAWEAIVALRTNVTPLGSAITERQFDAIRYSINLSAGDRSPWGASFTEAVQGYTYTPIETLEADNPLHMMGGYGNASQTLFTLDYTPAAATKVYVYVNGIRLAYTTGYTVSGKVITLTAAPANGVHIGVIYECDESLFG